MNQHASPTDPLLAAPAVPGGPVMRLNIFQQLMRSWTSLGPYNAGQAMRVTGIADAARWELAINAVIQQIGLGIADVLGDRAAFKSGTTAVPYICTGNLTQSAKNEINRPFAPSEIPLRFFIIPEGQDHWLLTVYDHWIADSWTIREFMRLILGIYSTEPLEPQHELHLTDQSFEQLFQRRISRLEKPRIVLRAARRYFTHRRSWRFDLANPMDFTAGLSMHVFPHGTVDTLIQCARSRQCSVNDLFVAAIAQAIGHVTASRRYQLRRRWWAGGRNCVSVGSIVDIRALADQPLNETFGLFLSSCINTFSRPEQHTLAELIRRAACQTRTFKNRCGAVAAFGELAVVKYFSELYQQPRHKALFFQKNCPLLAGISNVNLTGAWMNRQDQLGRLVQDYIRISPVGPLLPVVFALTTFRSRLNLCLTWRNTALTELQAAELSATFIRLLGELRP
jgi:hypothetical protein